MAAKCRQYELSVCPVYELETVQKEAAPSTASARILRDSGVDRFVTTAGAYLLNRFPMKGIQDTVGNAMVRVVLLTRALMERDEAISLVAEELSSGQQGKRYFLGRIQFYRKKGSALPMQFALRDLELHDGALAMRKRWQAAAESGRNVVGLKSLTGVLEMVNFIHLATKVDKDTRDYTTLLASGMSLVAVYASVHETVANEFFGGGQCECHSDEGCRQFAGGVRQFYWGVLHPGRSQCDCEERQLRSFHSALGQGWHGRSNRICSFSDGACLFLPCARTDCWKKWTNFGSEGAACWT